MQCEVGSKCESERGEPHDAAQNAERDEPAHERRPQAKEMPEGDRCALQVPLEKNTLSPVPTEQDEGNRQVHKCGSPGNNCGMLPGCRNGRGEKHRSNRENWHSGLADESPCR